MHAMSAGEAEAIYRRADATAKGINLVSQAVTAHGGSEAASLRVAEQVCIPFRSASTGMKPCWCPCRPADMTESLLRQDAVGTVANIWVLVANPSISKILASMPP